ncbi:RanBP2-type domain-containing protein [Phanerochaete sordida]|uniref:RanBP2-type domain-containing protein n=1 Tax=Phanerochaete sordida TaxID=48140 RepID=A0A9P3G4F3_9APHY|nr:RanBP2-type domain-containing protein [Phanerochaete sordida]
MPLSLLPDIILPPPTGVFCDGDIEGAPASDRARLAPADHQAISPHLGQRRGHSALDGGAYSPLIDVHSSFPADDAGFLEEAFFMARSRVVLMSHLKLPLTAILRAAADCGATATMPAAYTTRQDWPGPSPGRDSAWVIYSTHEEAASALCLSHPELARVEPALEPDLEPYEKLARVAPPHSMTLPRSPLAVDTAPHSPVAHCATPSSSSGSSAGLRTPTTPDLATPVSPAAAPARLPQSKFTLSTNPPNPKISWRPGDWTCSLPQCGAYNFGRNMTCIGCGNPHPYGTHHTSPTNQNAHAHHMPMNPTHYGAPPPHTQPPPFISPRFAAQHEEQQRQRRPLPPLPPLVPPARYHASLPNSRTASPSRSTPQSPTVLGPLTLNAKPHTPTYPLLTPSGHALSAGGRVRNISLDPSAPCIMYWPDNEPLPERGQIRPSGSQVVQYPPIVNTGNKGAAEKQPGDWTCSKCHYLNWRRRKVCQTCYPYAEGNGDSISQAVQAERIALLTNLLNQTENGFPHALERRASVPINSMSHALHNSTPHFPPQVPRHAQHASLGGQVNYGPPPAVRSRSQMDLRAQYHQRQQQQQLQLQQHQQQQQHDAAPFQQYAHGPAQRPIYQTPTYHTSRNSSPARSSYGYGSRVPSPTAAFLPACLQDVLVRASPAHSSPATSASSAELFDEYGYDSGRDVLSEEEPQFRAPGGATRSSGGRKVYGGPGGAAPAEDSIWAMDGEESKTLRPYAPIHNECLQELAGRLAGGLTLAA